MINAFRTIYRTLAAALVVTVGLSVAASILPACASDDPAFDRAVALFNAKRYSEALPILTKVIDSPNPKPMPIYYAGLCYQYIGNLTMAQKCYTVLCEDFPDSAEARLAKPVLARINTKSGAPRATTAFMSTPASTSPAAAASQPAPASDSSAAFATANPSSFMRSYRMSDAEWKKLPDESKVPFRRATSSHLYVRGGINGHPMDLMFDTGAEQCHFSRAQLAGFGITVPADAPMVQVQGVGGRATTHMILADVAVEDLHRTIPILVDDVDIGMPIIGETWFREFDYSIDNGAGFMRFVKKARPGVGSSHTYESTDVIKIPYQPMGDNMVVFAKVNGQGCPMIFDTGSFSICFPASAAAKLGLQIPSDARVLQTRGAGGSVMAYEFYVDRIELGPVLKTHVKVIVNAADTPPLPLLGQPFYKDRTYTVDTERHIIKFAH